LHSGVQSGNGQVVITYSSSADTTAPTTTISLSPASPNGQNGWYTRPLTISIAATDPDDTGGIQTRCVLDPASIPGSFADLPAPPCAYLGTGTSISQDGTHTVYAASEDPAGNIEAPVRSASFKLDQTAPTITASATTADGSAYAAGTWTNQTVTAHFTCADALSGVASCPADQVLSTDGVTPAAGGTATDNAGNQASASFGPIQVDKTPPVVSVTGVSDGASYTVGSAPTTGCTTTDALSGVATSAVLQVSGGTANGVGTFTATCAGAKDNADNSASASATYTVGYAFSGYLAPVNNAPTVNTGKAGRTYPLKFQLTDASGGFISSLSAVASVSYKATSCGAFTGDPSDALEVSATGGTSLRYDSTANQYVYNWATPGAGCYTLFLALDSGQVFPAYFNLR
jgi:hypothetical protein